MTIKTRFKQYIQNSDGVAAVEFALLAPILIFIFVGMFDFGRYLQQKMQLDNMARNAAEYVRHGGDADNLATDVLAEATPASAEADALEITTEENCECSGGIGISCSATGGCGGYMRRFFSIELQQTYRPLFDYPGLPDNIILTGFSRMQVE